MLKFRLYVGGATLLIFLSVVLFFVGRERASWRPQLVSQNGVQIVEARRKQDAARSQVQIEKLKKRFARQKFDIWAVSPDGKWMACDYQKEPIFSEPVVDVRDAKTGKLKTKQLLFQPYQPTSVSFSPRSNFLIINYFEYEENFQEAFALNGSGRVGNYQSNQVLFTPDEKTMVSADLPQKGFSGQAWMFRGVPYDGKDYRKIAVPSGHILLPIWVDGNNHVMFSDPKGNLWRVRIR